MERKKNVLGKPEENDDGNQVDRGFCDDHQRLTINYPNQSSVSLKECSEKNDVNSYDIRCATNSPSSHYSLKETNLVKEHGKTPKAKAPFTFNNGPRKRWKRGENSTNTTNALSFIRTNHDEGLLV
ncbi:hypothetical protein TNCV_3757981 [Trichonephila clavipes]|nr:hypothetical protein TNCV_3757981 [Trichonephila clavipes]